MINKKNASKTANLVPLSTVKLIKKKRMKIKN